MRSIPGGRKEGRLAGTDHHAGTAINGMPGVRSGHVVVATMQQLAAMDDADNDARRVRLREFSVEVIANSCRVSGAASVTQRSYIKLYAFENSMAFPFERSSVRR